MLQPGAHRRRGLLLVRRVAPGMQEADRHRLDLGLGQLFDGRVQGDFVQPRFHRAVRPRAFPNRQAQVAGHQRRGRSHAEIVALGLQTLPHFDDVAVALGGEHADTGRLALQQRIGRGGGAVDDARGRGEQGVWCQTQALGGQIQALQHPVRLIGGRGGGFGYDRFAVGAGDDDVGEGTADVYADCVCHVRETSRHAGGT